MNTVTRVFAMILFSIPAIAFGQVSVGCPDDACTHVVSVFKGDGGLIAEADGADVVTFVTSCDGVHVGGELTPNDDGVVSMLFDSDNGLACDANGGEFMLGPVKDGGWFWITDDRNSAVGVLVGMDVLDNEETMPSDAGASVEMTAGKGAVLLRHASTGRIGILQTILPEPEMPTPEVRKCGYSGTGTTDDPFVRVTSECALGDGGAILIATTTDPITGEMVRIPDGGTVTRPAGSASIDVLVDAWGNGSGHFNVRSDDSRFGHPALGWPEVGLTSPDLRFRTRFLNTSQSVTYGEGPNETALQVNVPVGGVLWDVRPGFQAGTVPISISRNDVWCDSNANPPINHPMKLTVTYSMGSFGLRRVVPPIVGGEAVASDTFPIADISFTVVCPP